MPLHSNYESNLAEAKEFELFVSDTLAHSLAILPCVFRSKHYQTLYGESLTGVEIKLDKQFRATGNLFIETEESPHESREKSPAGIYHHTSPWLFVIGDNHTIWVFSTTCLKREHISGKHRNVRTPTASGFLLSVGVADTIAARKWEA